MDKQFASANGNRVAMKDMSVRVQRNKPYLHSGRRAKALASVRWMLGAADFAICRLTGSPIETTLRRCAAEARGVTGLVLVKATLPLTASKYNLQNIVGVDILPNCQPSKMCI